MAELKKMLDDLMNEIKEVTEHFYQQKEHKAYVQLSHTMQSITTVIETLFSGVGKENAPVFSIENLTKVLSEAMNALEVRDSVLLADILQYDLMEQLEEIREQL